MLFLYFVDLKESEQHKAESSAPKCAEEETVIPEVKQQTTHSFPPVNKVSPQIPSKHTVEQMLAPSLPKRDSDHKISLPCSSLLPESRHSSVTESVNTRCASREKSPSPDCETDLRSRSVSPKSSGSRSPEHSRSPIYGRTFSKDVTSPPNVTVVQPSVSHPIFPYLYPYTTSSSSFPYPVSSMLLSGSSSLSQGLQMPFLPTSGHSELGHLPPSHAHALSSLSHFSLPGHPLMQPNYSSLSSSLSARNPPSPTQVPGPSVGPIFPPRPNPRYSPYALSMSKSPSESSSTSAREIGMNSPPTNSGISRPSPIRPRSPLGRHLSPGSLSSNPNNELKSMELMLNGLDGKKGLHRDAHASLMEK